jgi:hypothetical protein
MTDANGDFVLEFDTPPVSPARQPRYQAANLVR